VAVSDLERQLQMMLPPEILRGEKMDLNQPFFRGEGEDRAVVVTGGIPRELIPAGTRFTIDEEEQYAKGLYARHLFCMAMTFVSDSNIDSDTYRLRARELAQWAVNVVDFRDPDGINTPFEYDANPWNGWGTNGILKSQLLNAEGTARESSTDPNVDVVWGLERPELLMTESLALHDRMVGDFEIGGYRKPKQAGLPADDDLDQIRKPRGPLLIELHSPHSHDVGTPGPIDQNETASQASRGLYYKMPKANPILNMDKIEPGTGGIRFSVWRVALSEFHGKGAEAEKWSPLHLSMNGEESVAVCEPDRPSLMSDRKSPVLKTDRLIWLTSEQPATNHPDFGRAYYTETIQGFWPLKAQLPLGRTAVITPFANFTIGHGERTETPWIFNSTWQRFVFAGGNNPVIEYETETGEVSRTPALSIMSTSGPIPMADGHLASVSVSATEPLPRDYSKVYGRRPNTLRDQPCDTLPLAPMSATESLRETHSENNFKTAFLQRLANPAFGWNPELGHAMHDSSLPVNPYVTVDWIPIKLSVFNSTLLPGEIESWNAGADGDFDPDDPKFDDADFDYAQDLKFGTLEWNGKGEPADPFTMAHSALEGTVGNFWGVEPRFNQHKKTTASQRPPLRLGHSIGYVPPDAKRFDESGRPSTPRPWLVWRNRDYTNRFELLDVPKSSSSRLRLDFSTTPKKADSQHRFGHLLNFFEGETELEQLFDFIHVPDGFVDQYRMSSASSDANQATASIRRSRFREPGRVNINTMHDPRIWQAIGGDRFAAWEKLIESRDEKAFQLHSFNRSVSSTVWFRTIKQPKGNQSSHPLLLPSIEQQRANAHRHSWIHHQGWRKLAKLASAQSNIYAIWITIGFFELQPNYAQTDDGSDDSSKPWHTDEIHPDGSRIGVELFSRQGIRRHRAFYLVDRSIPVAFERGENHNVSQTVTMQRKLE